jgi:hypothetical protein
MNPVEAIKMAKNQQQDDSDEPKIVVTKMSDKLIALWDKELSRFHQVLTNPNADEATKKFAQEQIVKLHEKIFA